MVCVTLVTSKWLDESVLHAALQNRSLLAHINIKSANAQSKMQTSIFTRLFSMEVCSIVLVHVRYYKNIDLC